MKPLIQLCLICILLSPVVLYSQSSKSTITALGVVEYTPIPKYYRVHMHLKKYRNIDDMLQWYKDTIGLKGIDTTRVGQTIKAAIPGGWNKDKFIYFYYDAISQEEIDKHTDVHIPALKYDQIQVYYEYDDNQLKTFIKQASKNARDRAQILALENDRQLGKLITLTELNSDYIPGYSENILYPNDKKNFVVKVVYETR